MKWVKPENEELVIFSTVFIFLFSLLYIGFPLVVGHTNTNKLVITVDDKYMGTFDPDEQDEYTFSIDGKLFKIWEDE